MGLGLETWGPRLYWTQEEEEGRGPFLGLDTQTRPMRILVLRHKSTRPAACFGRAAGPLFLAWPWLPPWSLASVSSQGLCKKLREVRGDTRPEPKWLVSSELSVCNGTGIWKMPRSRSVNPLACSVSAGLGFLVRFYSSSQYGLHPSEEGAALPSVRSPAASEVTHTCPLGCGSPLPCGSHRRSQVHPCWISPRTPTWGQACRSISDFTNSPVTSVLTVLFKNCVDSFISNLRFWGVHFICILFLNTKVFLFWVLFFLHQTRPGHCRHVEIEQIAQK